MQNRRLVLINIEQSRSVKDNEVIFVQKNNGKIVVEIYNSGSSLLKSPYQRAVLATNQDFQSVSFKLPYGKYAISIYQDMNDNGKLDLGIFSIPKEPIGFGNNYKPY